MGFDVDCAAISHYGVVRAAPPRCRIGTRMGETMSGLHARSVPVSVWRRLCSAVAAVGLLVSGLTVAQVMSRVGVPAASADTSGYTAPGITWNHHIEPYGYPSPPAGNWMGIVDSATYTGPGSVNLTMGVQCDDGYVNELQVWGWNNGFSIANSGQPVYPGGHGCDTTTANVDGIALAFAINGSEDRYSGLAAAWGTVGSILAGWHIQPT